MFYGSIVALVTPMDEQGQIDYPALQRLVSFHLDNGTDGLVVAGTTGESATLTDNEFSSLLEAVIGQVAGQIPVLAGTGGADTAKAVAQTRKAAECGADGALVVTPYYNRPTQAGLVVHYSAVADATRIPLVLYNVPSRTAVDMQPETVAQLAKRDEVVAIKEAVRDSSRIQALLDLCGESIRILSGDDDSCLDSMKLGATGVVSVAANVVPMQFQQLCAYARGGEWDQAEDINNNLQDLYQALAFETNPIPVKWSLYEMGQIDRGIRLPLLPLADEYRGRLRQILEAAGLRDL